MSEVLVETFKQTEVYDGVPEDRSRASEMIAGLGLTGQSGFADRGEKMGSKYRAMTQEEMAVYCTLLPQITALESYDACPIPIRVLECIKEAKDGQIFDAYEVWHRAVPQVKDPILVGVKKGRVFGESSTRFLIARWGEVLESFGELRKMAIRLLRNRKMSKLVERMEKTRRDIADLKAQSGEVLLEDMWLPTTNDPLNWMRSIQGLMSTYRELLRGTAHVGLSYDPATEVISKTATETTR